jgi:putative ABC transport system substrate-binding protein
VKRREFITLLGGATAWPAAARAQQPAMPVIGFLGSGSEDTYRKFVIAFRQGLNESGYFENQNIKIEYRWAEGQYDRMPGLAADLTHLQVTVIVVGSLAAVLAAKAATSRIPIVFVSGDDPVKFGLVTSLNRPGGNLTGISFLSPDLEAKRIQLLRELVPKATRFAVLINPTFPGAEIRTESARDAAAALGLQLDVLNCSTEAELEAVFKALAKQRNSALLVSSDPFFNSRRDWIAALATRHEVAAIYFSRDFASVGALISYGASISDAFHQAGIYAGRIVRGEKPGDLPVLQPTKFELVINVKTARALGLEIPDKLLALADEVIE